MFERKLREILINYPDSLAERPRFLGILRDFFPEDRLHANLLMMAYDAGIHSDIAAKAKLTDSMFHCYKKILTKEYGISDEYAAWCVATWFSVYGKDVLGKEISSDLGAGHSRLSRASEHCAEFRKKISISGKQTEKDRVDLSKYDDGQKLPKNVIYRDLAVEKKFGITDIKCTFSKNDWFGDCGCLKVMGEVFAEELAYDDIIIFFTVRNDRGEIIGVNFGEKISKDEFNGYYTFSRNIDIPKDEYISEIRIRPVQDPYFADR
ncbi:MAG: hypothetical protein Q4D16_18775 [Eubacteriales bacterium]|nr:hypothetical protein [Eubacteriales bacterium]